MNDKAGERGRWWDVLAALRGGVVSSTAGARWDEVCTVEGFLLPRGKAVCAAMERCCRVWDVLAALG